MITKQTATDIWIAYDEIAKGEGLLKILREALIDDEDPDLRDSFGRRRGCLRLGVPSGENSHQLLDVHPRLAVDADHDGRRWLMSDRGPFEACPVCGKHDWKNRHRCQPRWECEVWNGNPDAHFDDANRVVVHACNAESAAEELAEEWDAVEYRLLNGHKLTVRVRPADGDVWEYFSVTGEAVVEYDARQIEAPVKGGGS